MLDNTLTRFADALERIATALENMQTASTNVVNVSGPSAEEMQEAFAKTIKETTLAAKTVLKDMDAGVGKSPKAETPAVSAAQTVADQKTTPADSQESQAVQSQETSVDSATEPATSTETQTSESASTVTAKEEKTKEVSVDEARAALRTYSQTQGTQNALEILSKLGAKAISDLDAAGRAQLLEMVQG